MHLAFLRVSLVGGWLEVMFVLDRSLLEVDDLSLGGVLIEIDDLSVG